MKLYMKKNDRIALAIISVLVVGSITCMLGFKVSEPFKQKNKS